MIMMIDNDDDNGDVESANKSGDNYGNDDDDQ